MTIQETVTVDIASVEVNDDYRVELTQMRKVMDYSAEQAMRLGTEIVEAAAQAMILLAEHQAEIHDRAAQSQPTMINGQVVL